MAMRFLLFFALATIALWYLRRRASTDKLFAGNEKQIPVLPTNYRRIALYAISVAADPVVLVNRQRVQDFSEAGPLTQKKIRPLRNFEIRDGESPILGFHDHPNEMWVSEAYAAVAEYCASQGWLKIQRPASTLAGNRS
jgi:hypothetical protein